MPLHMGNAVIPEVPRSFLKGTEIWESNENDVRNTSFRPKGNQSVDRVTTLNDVLLKREIRSDEEEDVAFGYLCHGPIWPQPAHRVKRKVRFVTKPPYSGGFAWKSSGRIPIATGFPLPTKLSPPPRFVQ